MLKRFIIRKRDYILDPTKASSLPYWKTISLSTNKEIKLVDKVEDSTLNKYYFRLVHYLKNIEKPSLSNDFEFASASLEEYAKHINACYDNIGVTKEELEEYKKHKVYDASLWLAIKDKKTSEIVATLIAEFDDDIKEGIIEWVEVSKEYRRMGLGEVLVKEALYRLKDKAKFVTISGDMNNPSKPVFLYEKCGFTNKRIWCIK